MSVKKRSNPTNSHQSNSNVPLRSNYFGYHDSRRKLPTSGMFRHFITNEEHIRFYRVHLTVADVGRYAEIWKSSLDPTRPPIAGLHKPGETATFFSLSNPAGNWEQNQSKNQNDGESQLKVRHKPKRLPIHLSEVVANDGNAIEDKNFDDEPMPPSIKFYRNKVRQTSDVLAVGSGPVFVCSPHQSAPNSSSNSSNTNTTTIINSNTTTNNKNSTNSNAPPGPWPIRPWALAQIDPLGKAKQKVRFFLATFCHVFLFFRVHTN